MPVLRDLNVQGICAGLCLAAAIAGLALVPVPPPTPDDGEAIYNSRCLACHQADGQGVAGVFPPLTETEWVTGDKGVLIRLVLDGMMGPIEVQGMVYQGAMPPWKAFLSDEEVAALLTYIRQSWGNDASSVSPSEVAAVRLATGSRARFWTAEELADPANQGIPE